MSDERDGADADLGSPGNDTEGTGGPQTRTAVATRPQRPTGKRSRQRVDTDDDVEATSEAVELGVDDGDAKAKKAKKTKKKPDKDRGPNPIIFVYNYLKQVVAELRKVIWPNRKQMITYTSVVLAFLVFMVALVGVADLGLAKLVMLVFGNG